MTIDLRSYLSRIAYGGPLEPTLRVLQALHEAHVTHIPFENLDLMLGRPIRVDLGSIQDKLVRGKRGGYCFEQNTLFAAVLRDIGFEVDVFLARVRRGATRVLPRTHMVLQVHVGGERWLADVGFGADGLLRPAPLDPLGEVQSLPWVHRIVPEEPGLRVMQSLVDDAWMDLYAFTLEPQYEVDVEMSNHFVSTWPESRFVQTLTAQRVSKEARHVLRNRELTIDRGIDIETRHLRSRDEVLQVLDEVFGLPLPADAPLRTPE
jgi:N-hydroxyarylamine O-acetyltransferase